MSEYSSWSRVFEDRAAHTPDASAVDDGNQVLSCHELDERANALATALVDGGLPPGAVVGVVLERTVEFAIAILAVAKAGGAFMLADPDCPPERLRYMVAEARVGLVLTDAAAQAKLSSVAFDAKTMVIDTSSRLSSPPTVEHGEIAYVVFTSGTTGKPKGIVIDHEGVVNLYLGLRAVLPVEPDDRMLQFLTPNFDGCLFDVVQALLGGTTLVLARTSELVVGQPLVQLMRRRRITVVLLTPSIWAALPDAPLPDLRVALAVGERLPSSVVARWRRPGRRFFNLYGPAETAVAATAYECVDTSPPAIGWPLHGKRLMLVDDQLSPVPAGTAGELCIGGVGIGRYLNRPQLMAERFISDPAGEPGAQMYRTGDICRQRPDGGYDYIGRRDRQVKILGQRIELDEVETVLCDAPGVRECVVVSRGDYLEALIVPENGSLDLAAVTAYLNARLYSGMIPHLRQASELPRNSVGKRAWTEAALNG